jgi:YD repeat-containing protein
MNLLGKLKSLFADSKMRIVLILFILLLLGGTITGIIFAIRYMTGPLGAEGAASLKSAPTVKSVVGGWEGDVTPAYRKSQEQFNKEQEEKARKEGTSSVPSLIDSKNIPQDMNQENVSGGVGFAALKASEREGGETKAFDSAAAGTLVCDNSGNVFGAVGADGLVRDACGKVEGKVLPDGSVANLTGKLIGKVCANAAAVGSLVYDANGNVIGTVGADGLVRDASGKVIGKVLPDGSVVDLNGKTMGKVGSSGGVPGTLVYDANGNVIGTVGADGLVRDASGKVIGKVLPDGSVVDLSGKVIGKMGAGAALGTLTGAASGAPTSAGTLVYDSNGNVIGTVGADGLVRDANGKVIGKVLPDGSVVNTAGKTIGKVGSGQSGTLVYGPDGKVLGRVGADGIVRDANGNPLDKIGPDGILRDANGNEIGRVASPATAVVTAPIAPAVPAVVPVATGAVTLPNIPGAPGATTEADARLKAVMQRQQETLTAQQQAQMQQQIQAAMTTQSTQLFAAWASPMQAYVEGVPDKDAGKSGGGSSVGGTQGENDRRTSGAGRSTPLVKAGTIQYAVLDTAVNTDEPGPILATIVEGKLKGSRLIGTVTRQEKKAMLTFTVLTGPMFSSKASINAVAIDPDTARTGIASDVDSHYWLRYGTLFGAAFVQGYAQVLMTSGATITPPSVVTPGQVIPPNLSPKNKLYAALGNVGTRYQAVLGSNFNTPPTVTINSGIGLAILFLDDVAAPPPLSE